MKKYHGLLTVLLIMLLLTGCSKASPEIQKQSEPAAAHIPGNAAQIYASHTVSGQTAQWIIEGSELDSLRTWSLSLRLEQQAFPEGASPGDADGGEAYSFALLEGDTPEFSYIINGADDCYILTADTWYSVTNPTPPAVTLPEANSLLYLPPMVMVDDEIYYDTGKESELNDRCGVMDGEITSQVSPSQIPVQNNQSNFGTGYSYQYVNEGQIELFINEKWIIFENQTNDAETVSFHDKPFDRASLSQETLKWLTWYNSLDKEMQLKINYIPAELIEPISPGQNPNAAQETK